MSFILYCVISRAFYNGWTFSGWGIQCWYLNRVSEVVVVQLQITEVSKLRRMYSGEELEDSHNQSSGMWRRCLDFFFLFG